jgi:ABC-type branched-subunit amino acid transport system ATPase component
MNILEAKELHHEFGGLQVSFGIDLQVKEGERHAIIGPNGAGKTPLYAMRHALCARSENAPGSQRPKYVFWHKPRSAGDFVGC